MQRVSTHAMMSLAAGGLIFCLGGILVKFIPMSGLAVAFWRLWFAALILFALTYRVRHLALTRKEHLLGALSGVFLALDLTLWHESIYAIGPGIATVLNNVQVFFGAIFGLWLFCERLTRRFVIYMLGAVVGMTLIASPEILNAHNRSQVYYGVLTGVSSALMYALALLSLKPLSTNLSAKKAFLRLAKIMSTGAFAGAITCGAIALFSGTSLMIPDLKSGVLLLVYGTLVHVLGWILIARAMPILPVALSGLILITEPVFTLLFDIFIFTKSVTEWQWLGISITLGCVYLGSKR